MKNLLSAFYKLADSGEKLLARSPHFCNLIGSVQPG